MRRGHQRPGQHHGGADPAISGSFTLNWGTDTNDPDADVLVYNGTRWSFDALWSAACGVAVVVDGALTPAISHEYVQTANEDGSYTEEVLKLFGKC